MQLVTPNGQPRWLAEPDDWAAVKNQRAVRNVTQPIRFQGQWHDEESGLYYNRHRYYDPQQGRYISQDPIGLKGGGNLYGYVGNPTGMVDPLGLEGVIQCAQNGQGTADRVAGEVTARGNFKGKGEADWIYQNNSNPNLSVTVDASQLTVESDGNWGACPNGHAGSCSTGYITGDDYAVHGQGTIRHRPDGTYGVYNQRYDYELHFDFSPRGIGRNLGTIVGSPPGGWPNTPFTIEYKGDVNITNPRQ